ncbi:hypothetical protein EXIGLDRAFT_279432 [Exidia glandulosa HHB12029]|uniref:Uncharacterized protein n=1 Tax=Exidia glandulosa HHB12029 TaxID=1314781 RepID=A0A165DJI8_EXIGL|nr:hypothetical protein EXIGLDRAFT_279432 [Exidia glandulosa HHB12029]
MSIRRARRYFCSSNAYLRAGCQKSHWDSRSWAPLVYLPPPLHRRARCRPSCRSRPFYLAVALSCVQIELLLVLHISGICTGVPVRWGLGLPRARRNDAARSHVSAMHACERANSLRLNSLSPTLEKVNSTSQVTQPRTFLLFSRVVLPAPICQYCRSSFATAFCGSTLVRNQMF